MRLFFLLLSISIAFQSFGQSQRSLIQTIETGEPTEADWINAINALADPELRGKIETAVSKRKAFPRKDLVELLTHQQLIVRNGSIELLESASGDDFGFNPWEEPGKSEANQLALQKWLQWAGSDSEIQRKSATLSEEQTQNYIQQLLAEDPNKVSRAIRMLEGNNFHAVASIQSFLNSHSELPEVKRQQLKKAQYELVLIKSSRAKASSLARDLTKGNRDQQLAALSQLKKLGLITIPIIRDFTDSSDALIRETAIDVLLSVGGAQVLPLIAEDLSKEQDVNVLHVALKNLKEIRGQQSLDLVLQMLEHSDEDIVVSAIQALTKIYSKNSGSASKSKSEEILKFLDDPRWRVRDAAVQHVTKIKPKAAGPKILELLENDEDEFVRSHCIEAVVALKLSDGVPLLKKMFLTNDALIGTIAPAILDLTRVMPNELLEHLKTRDPDTIISALGAFTGDKKPELTVLAHYANHQNTDVSCAALRILGNDEDKLKFDFVANTLTDALNSKSEEKIQAVLSGLDLPTLSQTDARLKRLPYSQRSNEPTPLDPLYDAFLKPNGKPLHATAAITIKTQSSGGVKALVNSMVSLASDTAKPKRTFQICLLLTKAGEPRGLKMIEENIAEMPISKRASLAESLYNPKNADSLAVFEVLLQDPADDIREEAAENAFSNEKNIELIKLALEHFTRKDTKLKPSDAVNYSFFSCLRKPSAARVMRDWATTQLDTKKNTDEVQILALTILSKSTRLQSTEQVKHLTQSSNPWVRRAAWYTLASANAKEFTKNITAVVEDKSPHVRAVIPEMNHNTSTDWDVYFNDTDTASDSSYSSSRRRRRLTESHEKALKHIAENDSSATNRFEATFCLLTHSREIDLEKFIALLGKLPKEVYATRRLSDYVESNYSRMGKGMRPILAYIDFKRIDVRHHQKIMKHFQGSEDKKTTFNSFASLAQSTDLSDAPQHVEVADSQEQVERTKLVVVFFEKEGCKQCAKALELIDDLKPDFPLMEIQSVSMSKNSGILLNDHLSNKFSLPSNSIGKTPSFFTSHGYITPPITAVKLGQLLEETMATPQQEGWFDIASPEAIAAAEERVDARYDSLTLPIVIAGGLLDGINPCAFATIIFFLSYLGVAKRSPKEIFFVGSAFILAIFLSYLSVGLVFNEVIGKLTENDSYQWLKNALNYIFAGFALLVAVLSLRDFWRARQGRLSDMTLQLPNFLKNRIRGVIRKGAKSSRFVIAAFFSGIAISFLELACTGQVYAPIIYKINQGASDATYMLILYNLAFILPLVIIFALAMGGMKSNALIDFQQKHTATVKLLTGLLFLLLAAVLIFADFFSNLLKNIQPALLNLLG